LVPGAAPAVRDTDAEALVLDPCFRSTYVEEIARRLPCPVEWHGGFVLGIDEVRCRPDFKTPEAVTLAERIAAGDLLDARILGEAARAGRHDPLTVKSADREIRVALDREIRVALHRTVRPSDRESITQRQPI